MFSTLTNMLKKVQSLVHHLHLLHLLRPLSNFRLDLLWPYTQAIPCNGNINIYNPCVLGGRQPPRCPCNWRAPPVLITFTALSSASLCKYSKWFFNWIIQGSLFLIAWLPLFPTALWTQMIPLIDVCWIDWNLLCPIPITKHNSFVHSLWPCAVLRTSSMS